MSKRIAILVEGATEKAFMPVLRKFLEKRLSGKMPKLDPVPYDKRIPTKDKLRRVVINLLSGKNKADAVIALTDVYTGTEPREFLDAEDAKGKMRDWVEEEPRFFPHVALHDFEAWLLPFWETIQQLAGSNRSTTIPPEQVNHNKPPARLLQEVFRSGKKGKSYVKPRDAVRILKDQDLAKAADACPELRKFLDTIVRLCESEN
ncbi:MAG: DUF4276 family protein [Zoogloeaceae bacterium]|jgi:hypothetical protein|nr:DUF4276 family protein [Zoogloeaceae bacterium]